MPRFTLPPPVAALKSNHQKRVVQRAITSIEVVNLSGETSAEDETKVPFATEPDAEVGVVVRNLINEAKFGALPQMNVYEINGQWFTTTEPALGVHLNRPTSIQAQQLLFEAAARRQLARGAGSATSGAYALIADTYERQVAEAASRKVVEDQIQAEAKARKTAENAARKALRGS